MFKRRYDIPFFILIGTLLLIIFSKNSWLYAIHSAFDQNTFMTVGHAWTKGIIPYRDIFEQKGPVLFMVYALAAKAGLWFRGVFLLELVFMGISLALLQKTFYLLTDQRWRVNTGLALYFAILLAPTYFQQGGSVEELVLPAIIYLLYLFTKVMQGVPLKNSELISAAALMSIAFWMKFTLIATYLVFLIAYTLYLSYRKRFKDLTMLILINIGTLVLISGPILLYFTLNHGLTDLIRVYFYDNIFMYGGDQWTLYHDIIYHKAMAMMIIPIIVVLFWRAKTHLLPKTATIILWVAIIANLLVTHYLYYLLILVPLIVYLIFIKQLNKPTLFITLAVFTIMNIYNSSQLYETRFSNYQSIGQQLAKITHQSDNVLLYGFLDFGTFNVAKTVPINYYYMNNNIPKTTLPELYTEPSKIIMQNKAEYVIASSIWVTEGDVSFKNYSRIADIKIKNTDALKTTTHIYVYHLKKGTHEEKETSN